MLEMGVNPKNLGYLCKLLDKITFIKVQYLPFLPKSEKYLTFHTADFTIEGSTAIKNTMRSDVCGIKCCLFLIFPF